VEQTEEFESWLFRLLLDGKRKLGMKDSTIAYILFREATRYYLKALSNKPETHYNQRESP